MTRPLANLYALRALILFSAGFWISKTTRDSRSHGFLGCVEIERTPMCLSGSFKDVFVITPSFASDFLFDECISDTLFNHLDKHSWSSSWSSVICVFHPPSLVGSWIAFGGPVYLLLLSVAPSKNIGRTCCQIRFLLLSCMPEIGRLYQSIMILLICWWFRNPAITSWGWRCLSHFL